MIDLHIHLDGSLSIEDLLYLAKINHVDEKVVYEYEERLQKGIKSKCRCLQDYLSYFDLPVKLLQNAVSLTYATYSLFKRLSKQGLIYAEVRFAPCLHLENGLTQSQAVLATLKGLEMAKEETLMPGQIILCCMRGKNEETNLETIKVAKEFYKKGVCGVDLAGSEKDYKTEEYKNVFRMANENNIPITIHAGEDDNSKSIWEAIRIGARRIGHGVASIEDPMLMEFLSQTKIALELCPTSEVDTHAIKSYEDLPLRQFLKKGIKVTINTDDMAISNITLEEEFKKLQKTFSLNEEETKTLLKNSIESAFLDNDQKDYLLELLEEKYNVR